MAQNIIGTHIVTKIHEDWKINVTSVPSVNNVLLKQYKEKCPTPGSHVFQPIVTIFELIQDIIETYILAKFYDYWIKNVASTELTRQMFHDHRLDEFVGSLPTRGAISLSPPQTPSTGSSQETDSTMPSCNIENVEVNVKL
ncbi:hypothetical protein DPMN_183795 [Dreissena polymorpha]|uniref:Uncharacterized protein n=1 Tax=Dreissena polymorpha TaxID=45954 RepID=A0A9D4DKJ2_DREPO|nr:hypothetical protein DPMN_183795 [Dreissena polymorpha]